jgi:hypothetical protein
MNQKGIGKNSVTPRMALYYADYAFATCMVSANPNLQNVAGL